MGDVPLPRRRKVAVIGSGLAGLATAYMLAEGGVDVWLIERAPRLGFYAHSVELDKEPQSEKRTCSGPSTAEPRRVPSSSLSDGRLSPVVPKASRRVSSSSSSSERLLPSSASMSRRVSSSSSVSDRSTPSSPREKTYSELSNGRPPISPRPPRRRPSAMLGEGVVVDVPMRSFQGGYYPQLLSLYRHLGLDLRPESYTFAFSSLGQRADFTYEGASGVSFPSVPRAAFRNPFALVFAVVRLLVVGVCYIVFLALAFLNWHSLLPPQLQKGNLKTVVDAAAERLDRPLGWGPRIGLGRVWVRFVEQIVLPLFSAVGTMTVQDVWSAPAQTLLDYIHSGVGTQHYALAQSSRDVAIALAAPPVRLRLGISVTKLRYFAGGISGGKVLLEIDGGEESFDHVVLATEASAALKLLESLEFDMALAGKARQRVRSLRQEVKRAVQYRESIVVTHTDEGVLPIDKGDRRRINLVRPGVSSESEKPSDGQCHKTTTEKIPYFAPGRGYVMATHETRGVLQTTNPIVPIDATKVLGVARMERALPFDSDALLSLVTRGRSDQKQRRPKPSTYHDEYAEGDRPERTDGSEGGDDLVHLVGSYVYPGIPLLEGCVGSARRVAREILGHDPDIDWDWGRGGMLGRAWRWRREPRVGGVL